MPRSLPRLILTLVNISLLCPASTASLSNLFVPTVSRQGCPIILPTAAPSVAPSTNYLASVEERVIGGLRALPTIQSFLVSLSHPNDSFACTGSVISARWVLTAAHCLVQPDWKLRVASERPGLVAPIPIRRVIPHSSYVHGQIDSPGDIALIELAGTIPAGATFVNLNDVGAHPPPGAFARTAGYGREVEGLPPGNTFANQVDVPVNSPERCRRIYHGYLNIRAQDFICVGYDKSRCRADSCNGDSGGPVLQYNAGGEPVQIGVVSFGFKCGKKGIPSVGVRVSTFTRWIEGQGAMFFRGKEIASQFADGSREAAQNETDLSVQSDDMGKTDPRFMLIPKATFIIICVIAGFAVIALVVLSVSFIKCSRSHLPSEEGGADGRSEEGRGEEGCAGGSKVEKETSDEEEEAEESGGVRGNMPLAYSLFRVPSSMIEDDDSSGSLVTAPSSLQTSSLKGSTWGSVPSSLPRAYQLQLDGGVPRAHVSFPSAPAPKGKSGRRKSAASE